MRHSLACAFAVISAASLLDARQPVRARHAMVVAEEPQAARIGASVLESGGNAVDAAVAVGFALAVTHPAAGNIGGGGFLLYRTADGRVSFLDFRERAPGKASRNMYLDAQGNATGASIHGWRASGVPGTVRGLEYAHRKWGRKSWSGLLDPAVRLARDGFVLSYSEARGLKGYQPGDRYVQPELAATLGRIARFGAADFYEGQTARILAREMAKHGGLITEADLRAYRAVERKPLQGCYKGYEIWTAPPPSSGGIGILQMLGVLEGSGYEKEGWGAASTLHFEAEAMRRYYADRAEWLGDPDFFKVPVGRLLDPAYIRGLRASIDPAHATPSGVTKPLAAVHESSETTHFSIVDGEGNAVALTYTLNGSYGSGVRVPRLGFLLNNEMDDFAAKPGTANMFGLVQGEANAIAPRKTPLSSMTPTILCRSGKLYMVLGGPGGGRIITSVLQTILNVVDFNLNVQDAIDRPRIHHQWQPDKLYVESGVSPDTIRLLESRGHRVEVGRAQSLIEAIVVADGGWLEGGADGRTDARAEGY